ncbi:MAG: sulfotransferase [Planctomycetota bacterium]
MNKRTYVYILGASHSGSTLLAMLLNGHRDVATVGETDPDGRIDAEGYRCSCGEVLKACPFWREVAERMRARHPAFRLDRFGTSLRCPRSPLANRLLRLEHRGASCEAVRNTMLRLSLRWRRSKPVILRTCRDLAETVLEITGARVFIDSSKRAHRLKFLLDLPDADVKVIRIVRDGRAVALTYMNQDTYADAADAARRRGGLGPGALATRTTLTAQQAAAEWMRYIRSEEHLLRRLAPDQWRQIRYEQLCDDPAATLEGLFHFLGVDPKIYEPDFRRAPHHIIGNGMRLDGSSIVRCDQRWRQALNAEDRRQLILTAGSALKRLGYA